MGQARLRGTFEQRLEEAYRKVEQRDEHLAKLHQMEEKSEQMLAANFSGLIKRELDGYDKSGYPLLRADYTQIKGFPFVKEVA